MTASDGASPRAGGPRLVSKSAFIAAFTRHCRRSSDGFKRRHCGGLLDVGGITVSVCLCAPQPSGFLFFRVCVFHNVAHSSAWCAPLSTERQPPRHAIANYTFATGSHNHGIPARSSVECSSMVRTSTVNGYMFGSVRVG